MRLYRIPLAVQWRRVRASYWFVPGLMAIFAVAALYLSMYFDRRLGDDVFTRTEVLAWLNLRDKNAAGQLLTTVVGSIINIISIVFSLTMVVLAIAASQYGPQVLRNFMDDRPTKVVLGVFIGTFVYCLLTLRLLGGLPEDGDVPQISVTVALLFTLISAGMLVFFIHHIAQKIQVDNLIKSLSVELLEALDNLFPERIGERAAEEERAEGELPGRREPALPVTAPVGGYVQAVNDRELMNAVGGMDALLEITSRPGDFVVPGTELGRLHGEELTREQADTIAEMFTIGAQRTSYQDFMYSIEKLSEIAVRALSPGVNEPFVARKCVDYLALTLSILSKREIPAARRVDEGGQVRVIAHVLSFEEALHFSFKQIVFYARDNPLVFASVLDGLEHILRQNRQARNRRSLHAYIRALEALIGERHWEADAGATLIDRCQQLLAVDARAGAQAT